MSSRRIPLLGSIPSVVTPHPNDAPIAIQSAAFPGQTMNLPIAPGEVIVITGSSVRVVLETRGEDNVIIGTTPAAPGTRIICPTGFDNVRIATAVAAGIVQVWIEDPDAYEGEMDDLHIFGTMATVIAPSPGAQVTQNTSVGGTAMNLSGKACNPFWISTATTFQLVLTAAGRPNIEITISSGSQRIIPSEAFDNLLVKHATLVIPVYGWIEEPWGVRDCDTTQRIRPRRRAEMPARATHR